MKKNIVSIIIVLTCCMVALIGVIFILEKEKQKFTADIQNSVVMEEETSSQQSYEQVEEISIVTPYCTIFYPGQWKGMLNVLVEEGDVYTMSFYGQISGKQNQHLFDIFFGPYNENSIGKLNTLDGSDIYISVSVSEFFPDADWSQSEVNNIYAMKELLNDILQDICMVPNKTEAETPTISSEMEDMLIDTPYVQLRYPACWADCLYVEPIEDDFYRIKFYGVVSNHEPQLLFTLQFGIEDGEMLGMVYDEQGRAVCVSVVFSEFCADESWTENDIAIIHAMQEDINSLISYLPLN